MNKSLEEIDLKIKDMNDTINRIIVQNLQDRNFMSKNLLSNLRYLVEFVFYRIYITDEVKDYVKYSQSQLKKVMSYVKGRSDLNKLTLFHTLLQASSSHSIPVGDGASRVMIKYLDYLDELKDFVYFKYNIIILENIYLFPLNNDENMENFHSQVLEVVNEVVSSETSEILAKPYYVRKVKPIILKEGKFYEITLTDATDYNNKFNRIVVYSKTKLLDYYAIKISTVNKVIELFKKDIDIRIINQYKIAIRPCEINNFAKIFGLSTRISQKYGEYDVLMDYLKYKRCNLLDIVLLCSKEYDIFKNIMAGANTDIIITILDKAREIVLNNKGGANILRYLLIHLNNSVIKSQLSNTPNDLTSKLYLLYGTIPFDQMPYASSLVNHNVELSDLYESINPIGREHEFLSRYICENSDSNDIIYNKKSILEESFEDLNGLITKFNNRLYYKHTNRIIINDGKYVYVQGYEKDTKYIIEQLYSLTNSYFEEYPNVFSNWIQSTSYEFSDQRKLEICTELFTNSNLALIYGSAGCGKTELIKIISDILSTLKIVFIAKTNPAVENMKIRIPNKSNFKFMTIDKYLSIDIDSDLLIIDECSTVDNFDMKELLETKKIKRIILVGDIYQIESIKFGNWFKFAKNLLPQKCKYELTDTFRTTEDELKELWGKVRKNENDIIEYLSNHNMSTDDFSSLFEKEADDEIILCLNYDGPYGINSINKYLQSDNPEINYEWGINTYKIGDQVLFNDLNRFSPVLYNNLKGVIVNINKKNDEIIFDILVNIIIDDDLAHDIGLEIVNKDAISTTIRFSVYENTNEDGEDKKECIVPFVVAYATSIHKSQGLEYDSVKIVLNNEIEEVISINIFYTAITRAKKKLKIYWSPECMNKIIDSFNFKSDNDINIIRNKIRL